MESSDSQIDKPQRGSHSSEFGQNCVYFWVSRATPIGPLVPNSPDGPKRSNEP